jgi:3-phenylpropionate/cinnamic acid dioxygenase small subunit
MKSGAKVQSTPKPSQNSEVETFLSTEAWLLDTWQLGHWLALFDTNARYQVPSTNGHHLDSVNSLYLVDDDYRQLCFRVKRFDLPQGHAEQPHSATQRLVTNVLVHGEKNGIINVTAGFSIARSRHGVQSHYVGRYQHQLIRVDGELKFLNRKSLLVMPGLGAAGTVSIIV